MNFWSPFLLNEHDFVAENVEKLAYALVPEERADFGYDTRGIDWWEYWINIHIPALRRWTYPLIEGRPLEARPSRSFQLAEAESNGETIKTGTNGATSHFLTGSTGYIGGHVAANLLEEHGASLNVLAIMAQ